MVREPSKILRRFLIGLDQLSIVLALLCAYFLRASVLRPLFIDDLQPLSRYFVWLPAVMLPLWLFLLLFFRGYEAPHRLGLRAIAEIAFKSVAVGTVLLITFGFLLKLQFVSRAFLVMFGGINWLFLVGNRLGIMWYVRRAQSTGLYRKQVIIIGTGGRARKLLRTLKFNSDWGVSVIGLLDKDEQRVGLNVEGHKVLGTVRDIGVILREHVVDEVIVAVPRRWIDEELEDALRQCEAEGIQASFMADLFDVKFTRTRFTKIDSIPFLEFPTIPHEDWQMILKRAIDLVVSAGVLLTLWPLFLMIAALIKLTSPGPVFFVQDRVGYQKRRFKMLKFRTMVQNAETVLPQLLSKNGGDGPFFKLKDDPRVTAIGKLLRRTSLDELPQLFNVLKGDMSTVGPRPVPVAEVDRFDSSTQRKRFSVKPGLTCLWQINGRSSLPASQRVALDLEYISRWSLGLDLHIIAKTVPAVIKGVGAF